MNEASKKGKKRKHGVNEDGEDDTEESLGVRKKLKNKQRK